MLAFADVFKEFLGSDTTPSSSSTSSAANGGNKYFAVVSPEELLDLAEKAQANKEEADACPVCLCELTPEPAAVANGASKPEDEIIRLKTCKHLFHRQCIDVSRATSHATCRTDCISDGIQDEEAVPHVHDVVRYADRQPTDRIHHARVDDVRPRSRSSGCCWLSRHRVRRAQRHPSGTIFHSIVGHLLQVQSEHLRPGTPFSGTRRVAYLPNNPAGTEMLKLLKVAFERRLIFTVGDSVTSGAKNVAVWNNIHHKTHIQGGPESYGYPDPD